MKPVDMSPEAVGARLREASRLTALASPDATRVDMSPTGVGRRLREVAQLYALQRRLLAFAPATARPGLMGPMGLM